MKINQWYKETIKILTFFGSNSAKCDTEIALSHVTKKTRSWLKAFNDIELDDKELIQLNDIRNRRKKGEPIAYIIGYKEFWSLSLKVNTSTLIPRADTEILVEQALLHLPKIPCLLLDLGTGSGAIALALASERHDCQVIGCDHIKDAIHLAQYNAHSLSINNVHFAISNWFHDLSHQYFDMIVSNPPYICCFDPHLQHGDVRFEPTTALVAQEEGIADLRKIIEISKYWLKTQGWLLLEHGSFQSQKIKKIMLKNNYQSIKTINDYAGRPRVTMGKCIK